MVRAVKDGIAGDITGKPHLQAFCTDDCCMRYLRARHMNEAKAIAMLKETLKWCALPQTLSGAVLTVNLADLTLAKPAYW